VKNFKIIVFLGVDGAGKSTLIESIIKKNELKYEKVHFAPDYFRKKKNQIGNPHNKKYRGIIFSFLKISYWFINYQIFKIVNYNSKKIFFFDRYIYDIIIDPLRYRFSLSNKLTKLIIKFIIKPDLIILLTGNPNKIYSRKKELKLKNMVRLNNKYMKFIKEFDQKIILNCFDKIDFNKNKVLNYLKKLSL